MSFDSNYQSKVSVVILNWNGRSFLEKFLASVINSTYKNIQIIVADNKSDDSSLNYLKSIGFQHYNINSNFCPGAKLILELRDNYGFAKGYNNALKQISDSDIFILLNSDVEVSPNWIEPVLELFENDSQVAAAMPKVLMQSNKSLFEHAGAAGGWIDKFGYPFCRGRIFGDLETDNGQYDDISEVFWASGAALFIRSDLFLKAGGFDEYFWAHMEEIDLCWRLKRANYKIMVCPKSVVWHVGGGSLAQDNPKKIYLNFRNSLVALLKNKNSIGSALATVFIRLLLDAVAAMMFLLKGNFKHIIAIIRAHWHFFGSIFRHLRRRKDDKIKINEIAFRNNAEFNSNGLFNKSIVYAHFVKKLKKFTDLELNKKI